jgi:hypothetical protein
VVEGLLSALLHATGFAVLALVEAKEHMVLVVGGL